VPLREDFPKLDEGAYNVDGHLDRTGTVEDSGGHNRAVLGERERELAASTAPRF
jgi:hypothetical protein